LGRGDEARIDWQRSLEADPPEYAAWDGYAEFCLFLGQEDEYRRARQALLAKFGTTTNPHVMQRTALACLLRPATGDELRQAVALAGRAADADRSKYRAAYPYFLFVQGLADYRQGRFEGAIAAMRGEAGRVLGPAPGLVLAMALHRRGDRDEARRTLALAVFDFDWRVAKAGVCEKWMYHALRQEAEALLVPDLPGFLAGTYRPTDPAERRALVGVCQATDRTHALARLSAEIFADSPTLADDLQSSRRYNAACSAARAGCGLGTDAARLGDEERARWRKQARDWLAADLTAWSAALTGGTRDQRELTTKVLTRWQTDPDLAGLRDAKRLADLTEPERAECRALWGRVAVSLKRAAATE
jgi:serine/threonine-protein kinase